MGPRGPSRASKYQKPVANTLKNMQFLNAFGVHGLPRQPGKAQEGSQEAPKELQHLQNKNIKWTPKHMYLFD